MKGGVINGTHTVAGQIRDRLPATTAELAEQLNLPSKKISRTLTYLRHLGLVEQKRYLGRNKFIWDNS